MKFKVAVFITLLFLILPAVSCIVTSHEYHADISCDEFDENPTGLQDDFQLEIGDKLYIKLCSNPSTGFGWSYEMTGDAALAEEDNDFEDPEGDMVGAAGKETWTFEAIEKGTVVISMEYGQPWDGGIKGDWKYKVDVVVK